MMITTRELKVSIVLSLLALLIPSSAAGLQRKTAPKRTSETFVNGAPLTFDQVLRFIHENVIPQRRQKEAIQNRGVDFAVTPDAVEKLKAAGASDEMVELITQHAKSAASKPVTVKSQPRLGDLSITCAPAECEISIAGAPKGATRSGALHISGFPPGSAAVDFKKAGYIGSQSLVTIEAGKVASVSVKLEPDRATKEAFGEALFKKMIEALGGEAAVREALSIQAEGSATIWARDGASARWTVFVRNRPDRALIQAKGGGGVFHEVGFVGSQFKTSKGLKGDDARELPTDFGLLRDHQIAALIARLATPKFKMLAASLDGQDLALTAESSTETISVSLDKDLRPAQVRFGTATGLGSGIVTYSDYAQKGKAYYPQSMQVKPDSTSHGIDVHFDTVELNPRLKDADYNLRGKPLPGLAR
jgi:hypothetical protein